ncbi:MAG: hypothetical protein HYX76_08835 [Acidobacteria bacterium]|nr:hypothetical protein [Acidobacteriota bacterium]
MPTLMAFSAFTVFLAIAGLGFVFLLISLVFGGLFEHLDVAFDHDFEHGGPGFFSTRVMSVFVTAFGGFGAVASYYGMSAPAASFVGFVSGVGFGSMIYAFARFLYGQQASTDVRVADLVGRTARVIVGIPSNGVGQVRFRIGEELVDKIARSKDGQAIAEHATVTIDEVLGDTVVVREGLKTEGSLRTEV